MSFTDCRPDADPHEARPWYPEAAITAALRIADTRPGDWACDVGAGTGRLTRMLAARGLSVDAVEPARRMREIGERLTADVAGLAWHDALAEETGLAAGRFDLVTYGGSFGAVDQPRALREAGRLLRGGGHVLIFCHGPDWRDPSHVLNASGLFGPVVRVAVDAANAGRREAGEQVSVRYATRVWVAEKLDVTAGER